MGDESDASSELGDMSNEAENVRFEESLGEQIPYVDDDKDTSIELGDFSPEIAPEEHNDNVAREENSHEDRAERSPEMDDQDIAEMSIIAEQIESAEDFDLTFETVDTSESREESHEETRPKSRQSKKKVSPLYKSDLEGVEKFLEEGMNESLSAVEEAKMNISLADSLLSEWGTPMTKRKRSISEQQSAWDKSDSALLTSTPANPQKPLRKFHFGSAKSTMSSKKRSSTSSGDGDSPLRKRKAIIAENASKRSRSRSFSKSELKSPARFSKESHVLSTHPLRTRNV
ncbi:hypothetical protein COOONC_07781 [Cooperia oncophora]